MVLKALLYTFLLNSLNLFSQIDSISFDLNPFLQKVGINKNYFVKDFNFREMFCIIKTSDSLEYILTQNKLHGPFKQAPSYFHNTSLFQVETLNGEYVTYSTTLNTIIDSYHWADDYKEEWTKSIVIYKDKPIHGAYVLQQNGEMYGPFKNKPNLLWSNDTSTIYQVFKDNYKHFELFKDKKSLGKFHLSKCIHCSKGDWDIVYHNMFETIFGNKYLIQKDSLFGPLKLLQTAGISYINGTKYFHAHILELPNENFSRLFYNKKDLGLQLTTNIKEQYFEMFPDSNLLINAGFLKKYEYLDSEPEIYFYHTKYGLIDPPPIEKKNLINKKLHPNVISNSNFYLGGYYGENLKEFYFYKKNKFIAALSSYPTIIDNNYFYEKDWDYYMNSTDLHLPKNDAFCVVNTDTFYVIKTSIKTWSLYKNRVLQSVPKIDSYFIHNLSFSYYPLTKQLILSIHWGHKENFCQNDCPTAYYDIYTKKQVYNLDFNNCETNVSLYGEYKKQLNYPSNNSFTFRNKAYTFDKSKWADYQNHEGWIYEHLFLKQRSNQLTVYSVITN